MIWTRRDVGRLAAGAGAIAALRPGFALGATHGTATTISHGVSAFSDLKYPDGFSHFDYANPDAPVGGTFSTGYGGVTFDSLNPFILKGNPAIGLSFLFDSLMVSADDEADSLYGLVAKSVEIPQDRLWAAFELRGEARFSDGSPITAGSPPRTWSSLSRPCATRAAPSTKWCWPRLPMSPPRDRCGCVTISTRTRRAATCR
jgi:microcin C transport system substrate-binding protein